MAKTLTPGYVVVYPNRDKAANKLTKAVVSLILLISAGLLMPWYITWLIPFAALSSDRRLWLTSIGLTSLGLTSL